MTLPHTYYILQPPTPSSTTLKQNNNSSCTNQKKKSRHLNHPDPAHPNSIFGPSAHRCNPDPSGLRAAPLGFSYLRN